MKKPKDCSKFVKKCPFFTYFLEKFFLKSNLGLRKSFLNQNLSEEIRDLTAKDIGQKLGTLGRHMGHWADIKNIKQKYGTLSGNWGHWADIGQTLGRH